MNRFDHARLDELLHSRVRLAVMVVLAHVEQAGFGELRDQVGASDGNLASHLRRLEDAGYVAMEKSFEGRRPQTRYRISESGRSALDDHRRLLESLIPDPQD